MRRRQRGRAEEGARAEGEAGRGYRATCVAGAWRPRGERRLTRLGAARGNRRGAAQARRARGVGQTRELGWAERGARERRARR